jgi:hypothetical protein
VLLTFKVAVNCSWGTSQWQIHKRYSEFVELNTAIRSKQKISAILPPKKVFGKLSESVIRNRQVGLTRYLQTVKEELQCGKQLFFSFLAAPKELCSLFQTDCTEVEALQHETNVNSAYSISSSEALQDAPGLIVDNVSNQMIDVYLEPLQLKGRDAVARQNQYTAAVSLVEWPYDNSDSMEQHVNSILCAIPGRINAEAYASWGLRLKKTAVSDDEKQELTKAVQSMTESSLSLDLPNLAPFVVSLCGHKSAPSIVDCTYSGQPSM